MIIVFLSGGHCSVHNINILQRLQAIAVRAVTGNFSYDYSSSCIIKDLNLMNINERYNYFVCVLMYKCLNELAPEFLLQQINFVKDSHNYVTRQSVNDNLVVPHPNVTLFKSSFMFNGPYVWNKLSSILRNAENLNSFKRQYKLHLIN